MVLVVSLSLLGFALVGRSHGEEAGGPVAAAEEVCSGEAWAPEGKPGQLETAVRSGLECHERLVEAIESLSQQLQTSYEISMKEMELPPGEGERFGELRSLLKGGRPSEEQLETELQRLGVRNPQLVTQLEKLKARWEELKGLEKLLLPGGARLEMVFVPSGTFWMGCSPEDRHCEGDEKPRHEVAVDGFWMGKYEVTQAQWESVMGKNPSHFPECGPGCPVESVSWNEVQDFLEKAGHGLRLPTEAEWEYACRAGTTTPRYGEVDEIAWHEGNSGGQPHPVGEKQPNDWGFHDMLGNVYEWVDAQDGVEQSGDSEKRVARGASWFSKARYLRASLRLDTSLEERQSYLGFRVVVGPP